jgi:NNP family nitrate/nitrite transporter-like MFS transporter
MPDSLKPPEGDQYQLEKNERFRTYIGALLILTSIFFVNFMARIIASPLMPSIEANLGLTHAHAGSLFMLISFGYFLILLSSGFFSSRLTHRQTIIVSGIALGLALLGTAFGRGLWGIRLGLLAVGMAAGLYLPSGIATITASINPRDWGKAIAIHELAPNLSFVAAPLISEAVMLWFSWQAVFLLLGLATLVLAGIFARFGCGGEFCGEVPSYTSFHNILSKPVFWIMVILFSLGISGMLGIYTMLPLYLVTEHGIERHSANTLVAFSRIAGIGMTLVGGWATDRFGPKRVLKLVFLLTGSTTIFIGLASTSWVALSVFLQPMLAGCFFPAGLAALSLVTSDKERNLVVSLTVPIAFLIGGGGVPTLIGFIGDIGTFGLGIALVGGLILSGTFFSSCLK